MTKQAECFMSYRERPGHGGLADQETRAVVVRVRKHNKHGHTHTYTHNRRRECLAHSAQMSHWLAKGNRDHNNLSMHFPTPSLD